MSGAASGGASSPPPFPGAIGVTHLRVYDSEAPDGLRGGTPHLHSVCTEAYVVVAGRGAVQTLSSAGFEERPLQAGAMVWFTPGTIHRLVNHDGALEILVLMQNSGLPEAGDMVITFPPEVLADATAYHDAATLPPGEVTTAGSGDAARHRRDLGVEGFLQLRAAARDGDGAALAAFHRASAQLLAPLTPTWRDRWEAGPLRETLRTGELIEAISGGRADHLAEARVHELAPPPDERRMGCCGTLGTYLPAS